MLVVYTYSYNLRNDRILVNHRFITHASDHDGQANVQHLVWLCKRSNINSIKLYASDIVKHILRILPRVYHLKWHWYMPIIRFSVSHNSYFPPLHLHSLHLQVIDIDHTQAVIYASLLENILKSAVHLQCLSVPWSV
ncbi:unnamed protein product, partial [Rotaria sp. Silwood2]